MPMIRGRKKKPTKNESTREKLGMQDKHIVRIKNIPHQQQTQKAKTKTPTNVSEAEIISSHTFVATLKNTETFPKLIKDLKTKCKIFYSGKTRKYRVM